MTITLYKYIESEMIKKGFNEYVDDQGNLIFFDEEHQFMTKIFSYDADISNIVDKLFTGLKLNDPVYNDHFKKGFMYRFINRRINRQTIEAFKLQLMSTFITQQRYMNYIYSDLDQYIQRLQENEQLNNQQSQVTGGSTNVMDNRSAFANLPQNNVQLDVNSTIMDSASDNTISRNKQTNDQNSLTVSDGDTTGTNKAYLIEELFKTNGLEEQIYNEFDRRCFMQTW